jgi:hypothetical protein
MVENRLIGSAFDAMAHKWAFDASLLQYKTALQMIIGRVQIRQFINV